MSLKKGLVTVFLLMMVMGICAGCDKKQVPQTAQDSASEETQALPELAQNSNYLNNPVVGDLQDTTIQPRMNDESKHSLPGGDEPRRALTD